MKTLVNSLKDSDSSVLTTIARFWNVDITRLEVLEIPGVLEEAMLDEERASAIWDKLDDRLRGIVQTLLAGMNAGRMPHAMFVQMHGEIRKMGVGAIEREKPLENPQSNAEALFYRGLIFEGYEQSSTGIRSVVYVPKDFGAVLPTHRTQYDDLEGEEVPDYPDEEPMQIEPLDAELIENIRVADTTIVDDMATLLAYLQIYSADVEDDMLIEEDVAIILRHFIKPDAARLAFLFGIAVSAGLIDIQNGLAHPRRAETRRWLEGTRSAQLKALAEAWRSSSIYRDLWHVPGLHPEPTGWAYDPVVARQGMLAFMREYVPHQAWWSADDFIVMLHDVNPDFQRPGGDYESWYIRNDTGDYLTGFESWDAVEGALLEFYMDGPLHWLGMVDLSDDAVRLTAYGRAFVTEAAWPQPADPEEKITVQDDGTLIASRKVSRFDRFQAMRFTDWVSATPEGFTYKLNAEGIQRAGEQGINTGHIAAFVQRMRDNDTLPPAIARLLESWQGGAVTGVTLENLMVMRTTDPATLDFVLDAPALRRYLGARLGPMAVIVRADQWEALRDALGEQGIEVDVRG